MLSVRLGSKDDLEWAQATVEEHHYLKQRADGRARPMVYVAEIAGRRVGLAMVGSPHATRCGGWWGYENLPTQWQVVDLNRIWLDPSIQPGGDMCRAGIVPGFIDRKGVFRPTTPTWLIEQVLARVQIDRVSLWPPVWPDQPYHIKLVISYHDPQFHKGTIYRESNALPMYQAQDGSPAPGSSGKFGWCWRLPEPAWSWQDIEIKRPRTMRLF